MLVNYFSMQNFLVVGLGKCNKHSCYSFELDFITWVNLQFTTKAYEILYGFKKTNKSANDVTKLTINDYIMLHRKTTKELKNWTKTADHEGIQCSWPYRQEHLNLFFMKGLHTAMQLHRQSKLSAFPIRLQTFALYKFGNIFWSV